MPLLSVVIPTLNRPDTLRHAMATLAMQSGADCEFIIQNNGGNAETATLVNALGDPRFKHFATSDIVTMTENWELALAHASGEYVTFIGDDDGLMPDACSIAASILEQGDLKLLSWAPYSYYWPQFYHPDFRNRLLAAVNYQFTARRVASHDELARFYNYQITYARLPMIYNSFVHRDVIERVKARLGRYFLGGGPDVTSGIVNAALTESFIRLTRPLTISGLSQHSTGHAYFFGAPDALDTAFGRRDFGAIRTDPRLPDLNTMHLFLANDMLTVKAELFPEDPGLSLNFKGLAQAVATDINDRPEIYDRILQSIRELATRHRFDQAEIIVPARANSRPPLGSCGVTVQGPNRLQFLLDGVALGLHTIADAVRVMAQLTPGSEAFDMPALPETPDAPAVPVLGDDGLDFGHDGKGVAALIEGWSEPEDWGTWSTAKTCSMRVKLDPVPTRPVQVHIVCRAFVHQTQLEVSCRVGDAAPQQWIFTPVSGSQPRSLRLDPATHASDGQLTLTFTLTEPRSPADLGLSSDVRPLGIGIERMWIAG
jgi:hypothetical protein